MVSIRLNHRQTERKPCIWMQAGVVNKRFCPIDYECTSCRFDRALRRVSDENRRLREQGKRPGGKKGKIVFWKEKMNELSPRRRPCVHHMKGRIDFKACNMEYTCGSCEFDQYFYDQYTVHAVVKPVDVLDIKGFKIPQGYYLHYGHAWVKIEGGSELRIGIDDFALRLLGPFDCIEAPLVGKRLKQDRPDVLMRRDTHKAKILSPVSGVVTAINPRLRDQGGLANANPYSEGWVLRVHSDTLRQDLRNLMISSESKDFFEKEVDRLYDVIEEEAGPLAADGGHLSDNIYGKMPQLGWNKLSNLFLRT
ncbi:glycine cleavage system protein H [Thermodesulfobacteriota bacterium]